MGKWARKRRTGSNMMQGIMSAPLAADFSIGAVASPTTPINRLVAIPSPATDWRTRTIRVSDGNEQYSGISAATPINALTSLAATTYKIQVAWYRGTAQQSEWTTLGTVTTP
jgi:hypothetical protein